MDKEDKRTSIARSCIKVRAKEMKFIRTSILQRLRLCWKILITKGYEESYTIKELIEDEF